MVAGIAAQQVGHGWRTRSTAGEPGPLLENPGWTISSILRIPVGRGIQKKRRLLRTIGNGDGCEGGPRVLC